LKGNGSINRMSVYFADTGMGLLTSSSQLSLREQIS